MGSNEVSEGLSAVYRFEAKIDSASATQVGGDRLSYVGLSGGFGTLSMGRVGAAGAKTGGILDNSFHYGNSYTGFRTGNAISYSHSVGGVSVQLDAIMKPMDADTGKTADGAIDEAQLGISMNLGDFGKLAVSHVNTEDTKMDSMVDLKLRGAFAAPTIASNKVTDSPNLAFQTSKNVGFDPKSAKEFEVTYYDKATTESDAKVIKYVQVYHTADESFDGSKKAQMNNDGKLELVRDTACTSACTAESTWAWVTSGYAEQDENPDGVMEYTYSTIQTPAGASANATVTEVTPGEKSSHIAAEFGLGGITAFLGYSQVESKMKGAKKDKITHYGIRGGLGDSGVNFLVQLRSEDLQGSKPMDADRDPYVVNMSKSLGDGATAYIEHGTGDAKGEKANTRIGMIVNF